MKVTYSFFWGVVVVCKEGADRLENLLNRCLASSGRRRPTVSQTIYISVMSSVIYTMSLPSCRRVKLGRLFSSRCSVSFCGPSRLGGLTAPMFLAPAQTEEMTTLKG